MTSEFLINLILPIVFIYIAILYYMFYRRHQRYRQKADQKKYTLELCMNDSTEYENILLSKKLPYYKQVEKSREMSMEVNILKIVSYFEKVAIGMQNQIYDEEIVTQYYGKYFLIFYDHYKYSLRQYRDKRNSPLLFINYEKYVNKWITNPPAAIGKRWDE